MGKLKKKLERSIDDDIREADERIKLKERYVMEILTGIVNLKMYREQLIRNKNMPKFADFNSQFFKESKGE
jgi:hypothetical protein